MTKPRVGFRPGDGTLEPQPVRKRARTGRTAVQRYRWRDPDDTNPLTRSAREIDGWRQYCPLRAAIRRNSVSLTERHVFAADRLRQACDLAAIGASGPRELLPVTAIAYGPRGGPGHAALSQTRAWREFIRVMTLFDAEQRRLVTTIVRLNSSVTAWCAARRVLTGRAMSPTAEMQRLVACLNLLADHFAAEIDEDIDKGRLLAA